MPHQPAVVPSGILTVGHSTLSADEFLDLLQAHNVEMIVDVRKMPGSRRHPHFNGAALEQSLHAAGLRYTHIPALGGLRPRAPDSPNTGWKNISFQGYADYMLTAEFQDGLTELIKIARERQAAIMCAEAVPWRCHRSLIADALVVRGISVAHILGPVRAESHTVKPWAKVDGTRITYPPEGAEQLRFLAD